MKDRLLSISTGIFGSLASSGAMGIITDITIALFLAFLGGLLGYCGNECAKAIHKKIKSKNASK
jgi:hypothetical protein